MHPGMGINVQTIQHMNERTIHILTAKHLFPKMIGAIY